MIAGSIVAATPATGAVSSEGDRLAPVDGNDIFVAPDGNDTLVQPPGA